MSNFVKKSTSIILILTMLFSAFAINSFGAEAEDDYGVMPCWSSIDTVLTSFTISGIISTSTVVLNSQYSTSLSIKIELQKLESGVYQTIKTWTKTGTGTYLSLEETKIINIFSEYRMRATCTADGETHVKHVYPQ